MGDHQNWPNNEDEMLETLRERLWVHRSEKLMAGSVHLRGSRLYSHQLNGWKPQLYEPIVCNPLHSYRPSRAPTTLDTQQSPFLKIPRIPIPKSTNAKIRKMRFFFQDEQFLTLYTCSSRKGDVVMKLKHVHAISASWDRYSKCASRSTLLYGQFQETTRHY